MGIAEKVDAFAGELVNGIEALFVDCIFWSRLVICIFGDVMTDVAG